jgi:hypothetical protein
LVLSELAKRTHLGSDKHPKIFSILVSNSPRYSTFCAFRVLSVYEQIRSMYFQYTNRFIPRILSIQTAKFCSKIYLISRILSIRTDSFRVFSVYEQIHSTYSQYTHRFIPRIRRMHPNNFEYSGFNYFH